MKIVMMKKQFQKETPPILSIHSSMYLKTNNIIFNYRTFTTQLSK